MALKPLRDDNLVFIEKTHKYKINGTELDSVTKWNEQFYTPFDAKAVAKTLAKYPQNKKNKRGMRYWLNKWKAMTDHGTVVHAQVERWILNGTIPGELKAKQALPTVMRQPKSAKIHTEVRIYSEHLKLAGTVDLIVEEGNKLRIYDWKTNEKLTQDKIDKYNSQLNTYAYLLEAEYGYEVESMTIVHLTETAAKEINVEHNFKEVHERLVRSNKL